jgi:hypothetical protein
MPLHAATRRLFDRIGRLFPRNPRSEPVHTAMRIDASPQQIWDGILFYEEVPGSAPWHLRLFLPAPVRTEGDKRKVGAMIRCTYEDAHLLKRITHLEPGRLMLFDVIEQRLGVEGSLTMGEGSYEITPQARGCEVRLTTRYRGHVRPRWLARPLEHHLAHELHRYILRGMRAHIAAARSRRAGGEVAAAGAGEAA